MTRKHRLRTPAEFQHVRDASPRGWPHPLMVAYAAPNDLGVTRFGITVSGRVGNAVVRNKVRRRLREAVRARLDRLTRGIDIVLTARPAAARATWPELTAALDQVLKRAGATLATGASV